MQNQESLSIWLLQLPYHKLQCRRVISLALDSSFCSQYRQGELQLWCNLCTASSSWYPRQSWNLYQVLYLNLVYTYLFLCYPYREYMSMLYYKHHIWQPLKASSRSWSLWRYQHDLMDKTSRQYLLSCSGCMLELGIQILTWVVLQIRSFLLS